ncbi:MAG: hypothetical protein JWR17_1910 [Pseudomonas sp.]|nr:hypothetical protein [Pseudomonas sp.]
MTVAGRYLSTIRGSYHWLWGMAADVRRNDTVDSCNVFSAGASLQIHGVGRRIAAEWLFAGAFL